MADSQLSEEHAASRERLKALVGRLSEEQLRQPLGDGWTAAAVLAHLAFWERVALRIYERQSPDATSYPLLDEDITNDALLPEWLAMPPAVAVRLVLDAVEALDRVVEERGEAVLSPFEDEDTFVGMAKAGHRNHHLAELERQFPAGAR